MEILAEVPWQKLFSKIWWKSATSIQDLSSILLGLVSNDNSL
jgi:hypothetical protein